jgi:hypothetical protein
VLEIGKPAARGWGKEKRLSPEIDHFVMAITAGEATAPHTPFSVLDLWDFCEADSVHMSGLRFSFACDWFSSRREGSSWETSVTILGVCTNLTNGSKQMPILCSIFTIG